MRPLPKYNCWGPTHRHWLTGEATERQQVLYKEKSTAFKMATFTQAL